ncbi:SDR family oxidoreductase [Lentiprolixibacter aurantiacus]|uniref:SDR family oxidoreductase n=1 Tax=Lentiprolixibacter aurantiacus TaxID=2993939 RepID=A0AAE3SQR9_9FLAO|nr:SDR family oxidoreductase [Lentiprolixibacter aurantiacus]MCX2720707.1 SDR family oxidoreductase [Lentiprolixibacter aurantiacus]
MLISLEGKRALVGGSSKGIGRAIAQQLAASGASVTLMARSEELLSSVVKDLPCKGKQQHGYLTVDFADFKSYRNKIEGFFKDHQVDILVNNTQGPKAAGSLEVGVEDYQEAFDTLFKTVVYTTELALDHMIAQRWGRIINVTSISVKEPLSYLALSNTIRASVVTWAKTLSRDVAEQQITVNNVLTGYFDTERIAQLNAKKAEQQGIKPEEVRAGMEAQVPMKRIGKPEEYGALVTFLASDKASYLTGANIPLDGGLLKSF